MHGMAERITMVGHQTFDDQTTPLTSQTNMKQINTV